MLWTDEVWIFDLVAAQFLAPIDLLLLSQVGKELNTICRQDRVWKRHKDRVIKYMPLIERFFKEKDFYPDWFLFVTFLMKNPLRKQTSRDVSIFDRQEIDMSVSSLLSSGDYFLLNMLRPGFNPVKVFCYRYGGNILQKKIDSIFLFNSFRMSAPIKYCAEVHVDYYFDDIVIPYQCVVFDDMKHFPCWVRRVKKHLYRYWMDCGTEYFLSQ